jgi:receptor expression-enhancing protein 5/6
MSAAIVTQLDYLRRQIMKSSVAKYASQWEEKTKVNVEYLFVGLALILAALLFAGVGGSLITNLVGFLYPVVCSVKAIESKETDDDTQWLTYWVVYSLFNIFDSFAGIILYWIPFFYPLKLAFLLWCMLPQYKVYLSLLYYLLTKLTYYLCKLGCARSVYDCSPPSVQEERGQDRRGPEEGRRCR